MTNIEYINDAKKILKEEEIQAKKEKALKEVRTVENRVKNAQQQLTDSVKLMEKRQKELEKEKEAADRYFYDGDFAAYEKNLGITNNGSTGVYTFVSDNNIKLTNHSGTSASFTGTIYGGR